MTTRHKSLRYTPPAEEQDGRTKKPFTFTIRPWDPEVDDIPGIGEEQTAQERADELNKPRTFTATDEIPGVYVLDLGRVAAADEELPEHMGILSDLIRELVIPEDQARLDARLRDIRQPGGYPIGVSELMWLMNEVLEEVVGRPTEGQQASPTSLSSTPIGSTADGANTQATAV